jgi:NADPH2:quinone reductase
MGSISRAFLVHEAGGPFVETAIPRPAPGPGQVLVRVHASGVNPLDTKIRAGKGGHAKQPFPAILGLDMAGVVEELGPNVTTFAPGEEVFGMVGGVGGHPGTLADYVIADALLLARKPSALTMIQAAALPLSVITAWEGLVDRAHVHAGQMVLIHAGAGGIGHVAIQIARSFGANVFATVSPDKAHIAAQFGATPIDYTTTSVADYVAAATAGQGFDIAYDTIGGPTLDDCFVAIKQYGHVLTCMGRGPYTLDPLAFRGATLSAVFTLYPLITGHGRAHHGEILTAAAALAASGQLKPLLADQRFTPTSQNIAAAHARVAAGSLGKVVIEF